MLEPGLIETLDPAPRKIALCQEGPFCVFPRDYSVGEGETVVMSVEYLPSEVGVHKARFTILQARTQRMSFVIFSRAGTLFDTSQTSES